MSDSYNDVLYKERQNLIEGKHNVVPFPFARASLEFPGLGRGTYINVSGETKFGKTQFASFAFMLNPLWEAYHGSGLKLNYMYFNAEEPEQKIKDRIVAHLLFRYTKGEIRIKYRDLHSSVMPLEQKVIDVLEDDGFKDIRDYYFDHIHFDSVSHPTGISIAVKKFLNEHGTIESNGEAFDYYDYQRKRLVTTHKYSGYTQNDSDEFLIVFLDNFNNLTPEGGKSIRETLIDVSKEFKTNRNIFNISIVALQQQNNDAESIDALKMGAVEPKITSLSECNQVGKDLNTAIGIFSPSLKFKRLPDTDDRRHDYKHYNLDLFDKGNYFRTIVFMADRDGESGKSYPMFFDGVTCTWMELPKPSDTEALQYFYDMVDRFKAQEAKDDAKKDAYRREHNPTANGFSFFSLSDGNLEKRNTVFNNIINKLKTFFKWQ